jgi:hypothetical protein
MVRRRYRYPASPEAGFYFPAKPQKRKEVSHRAQKVSIFYLEECRAKGLEHQKQG